MSEYHGSTGHPMHKIAKPFRMSANPFLEPPPGGPIPSVESLNSAPEKTSTIQPYRSADSIFGALSIQPDQIDAPAFFVDRNLSISWIAPGGTDPFSRGLSRQMKSATTRNVFNLLLRPAIKHALSDWRSFFSFVYVTLRRSTARSTFDTETLFISRDQIPAPGDGSNPEATFDAFLVDSSLLDGDVVPDEAPLRIFSLKFSRGTLFLLRKDHWQDKTPGIGEESEGPIAIQSVDGKKSIAILSARLNHSHRLAETMLPQLFYNLMNRIWEEADGVVRSLGGKRAGCRGAQLCFVFNESAGRNPVFSAICCATRLNSQMALLEEKLKAQQGWTNEICVNMGISHGTDDHQETDPVETVEFVIPGGAFDQSTHLSAYAAKGEIWITKNAVAQLPKKFIDQVVLGVERQGKFLRNFFTRLSDLEQTGTLHQTRPEVGRLSVARVLKLDKPGPDPSSTSEA